MNLPLKKVTMLGIFISLAAALGFALAAVPNVEMLTATIFIAGYLLGRMEGLIVGVLAEGIYSLLNPYGIASPPLFVAQVVSMGLAGYVGGIMGSHPAGNGFTHRFSLGIAGFLLTLNFAVMTTLSFVLFMGFTIYQIIASFLYGLTFYVMHLVSNSAIFVLLVPLILAAMRRTGWFANTGARGAIL